MPKPRRLADIRAQAAEKASDLRERHPALNPESAESRPWIAAFLELTEAGFKAGAVARKLGLCRTSIYRARKQDPNFATQWEAATLKARLSRSKPPSLLGLTKPVFYGGRQIGDRLLDDSRVLIRLLRAEQAHNARRKPAKPDANWNDMRCGDRVMEERIDQLQRALGM